MKRGAVLVHPYFLCPALTIISKHDRMAIVNRKYQQRGKTK